MRAHGSVFGMWVRRTLPLTLLITAVTAAVQLGTFSLAVGKSGMEVPAAFWNMEQLLEGTWMQSQFMLGYVLVGLAAVRPLLQRGKWRYTLRRLRISEEAAILWYAAAVFGCFLLYWGAEAAVCLGLVRIASAASAPDYVSGQTAFLLTQGLPLFQSLLPVTSALAYVRNVMIFLTLGVYAAMGCRGQRWIMGYFPVFAAAGRCFVVDVDRAAGDIAVITVAALCLIVAAATLVSARRGGGDEKADL